MKRREADDKIVEMLAAAFLAGEGRRNKDIANMLGIDAVTATRHLVRAQKDYLRKQVRFLHYKVPPKLMEKVRQRVTRQALQDQLKQMAKRHGQDREVCLRVFNCGRCRDDRERMEKLGAAAAPLVRVLLRRAKSCGVTWGGMLKNVITGLHDLPFPAPWTKEPIEFIPLSGEPLGKQRSSFSSSSLARDLGIIVNGDQYDAPSLAMVPAFIPDGFRRHERDGVWKLIELVRSYDDIFGPHHSNGDGEPHAARRAPRAKRLDMILTSVGSHDKPLGFGRGVLFDKMSVSYDQLKSLIVAEVGGVCIPRANLSPEESDQLATVETSWTGLNLGHLAACATRGGDPLKGPPGVVVVSGGKGRGAVICELLKRGLINHLIIDDVLAKELKGASRAPRQA
jgi:DNA-binding transcriptional regulator LsrR (DeoR family)